MVDTTTPPPIADRDLFLRAAEHALQAFPENTGRWLADQFQATAATIAHEFAPYVDALRIGMLTKMAWEVLSHPLRPQDDDARVQQAAKALWETDFPPDRHMSWGRINQEDPQFVRRYLDLAKAALAADEAEHKRLYEQAEQWHDAWKQVDEDRPEEPAAAVVESLADWLVDHGIGIVDEGSDEEEGDPVYTGKEPMRELAVRLLTNAPGIGSRSTKSAADIAEKEWRLYYPGMEPDGFHEVVVAALAKAGLVVGDQPGDRQ